MNSISMGSEICFFGSVELYLMGSDQQWQKPKSLLPIRTVNGVLDLFKWGLVLDYN